MKKLYKIRIFHMYVKTLSVVIFRLGTQTVGRILSELRQNRKLIRRSGHGVYVEKGKVNFN